MSFLICFLIIATLGFAQIQDSFYRKTFLPWQGDTAKFLLQNGSLQSNSNVLSDAFYVTQPIHIQAKEWRLDIKLEFNTSSANYVDYVLASNNSDFSKADTLLYVRIGNTKDEISLYQKLNLVTILLIDGVDNVTNTSKSELKIIVKIMEDSISLNYATNWINPIFSAEQKIKYDTQWLPMVPNHTGLYIKQSTASFFGKHFFDNFYAGPIIKDTIAPRIKGFRLWDSTRVSVYFTEDIAKELLTKLSNFSILETGQVPNLATSNSNDSVMLTFPNSFISAKQSTLIMDSLVDLEKNVSLNEKVVFVYTRVVAPYYSSIIISEIYPKPNTSSLTIEAFEIYNSTEDHISLAKCSVNDFTSNELFPSKILSPKSYYVVCDDADTAKFLGLNVIPVKTLPSLNDAEDLIRITNAKNELIAQVIYSEQWHYEGKKSGGWSLEMIDLSKGCYTQNNFRSSANSNGNTLGLPNSVEGVLGKNETVKINSIYVNTKNSLRINWSQPIDYKIAVDQLNYQISPSLTIDSIVVVPSNTKQVFIYFKESILEEHVLRFKGFQDCSGSIIGTQSFTFYHPRIPSIGDLQITEIMFNAKTGCSEFIEIDNGSDSILDIKNIFLGVYSETKSVQMNISLEGAMLYPNQKLLLVQDLKALTCYSVCKEALILEIKNWSSLDDKKGAIAINNFTLGMIDSVVYKASYHSPLLADEDGVSLEKIDTTQSGLLPRVWASSNSFSNYASPGCANSLINPKMTKESFVLASPYFQTASLMNTRAVIQYKLNKSNYSVQIKVLDRRGLLVKDIANNILIGSEGNFFWDGSDNQGKNVAIGIYFIYVTAIHSDGSIEKTALEITKLD